MPSPSTEITPDPNTRVENGTPFATRLLAIVVVTAFTLLFIYVWYKVPTKLTPLAIPLAGLGVLFAIKYPALAGICFLFLSFFKIDQISYAIGPIRHATSGLSALTMLALFWHLMIANTIRLRSAPPLKYLFMLWALLGLSSFTAYYPDKASDVFGEYTRLLILMVALIALINKEWQVRVLIWVFISGGVILSLSAIWYSQYEVYLVDGSRVAIGEGTLGNPNDLALILLQPFAFAIALAYATNNRFERLILLGVIGLISIAFILGQSRAALIGIVLLLGTMGIYFMRSRIILLGALAVIGVGTYVMMDLSTRSSGDSLEFKDESALGRLYAWEAGVKMANDHPLTGVGVGNFALKFPDYTRVKLSKDITAHSIWFLVIGEAGWLAFIALVALTASCLLLALRNIRAYPRSPETIRMYAIRVSMLAGFNGYLVAASFNSYLYQWPLYFLILMSVALYHLNPQASIAPADSDNTT